MSGVFIGTEAPAAAARPAASTLGSTVPANGDVNPYGIVLVPARIGKLHAGELLVSNFNDKANNQGTGTTIDQITPAGKQLLTRTADTKTGAGSLFSLVLAPEGKGVSYVDDGENTLRLLH